MPRVYHVKKARKDNPVVSAGEPYFWWKHAFGRKQFSRTRPRYSQLCQGKNAGFYAALENLEDMSAAATDADTLNAAKEECAEMLGDVRDEYQEGWDNLPENFQYGSKGEEIQEAIDAIEELISELECWEAETFDPDDDVEDMTEDEIEESLRENLTEQADDLCSTSQNHCFPY